ncbi:hypothetical protein EXE58_03470 [Nocardioides seonyuensis]|uniref:Uncharacterized protein n=1 Tax=Nocardioides seonyuensis TaxID=2518371 RepID=A0A4P7IC14_9ACTN|nr:hypothetical protein [Nocardioides seonyuensis]QBX54619.1 hypothetical protein EXE58_03470 [Nocardioides seonyuensis]
MTHEDMTLSEQLLRECAAIPVDTDDGELTAIAIAIHLEESLGCVVPADRLDRDHLVPSVALERTVRELRGES